jgi:hypothetical protein
MEPDHSDKRREPRFPIETGATVEVQKRGEIVNATTVNISGCGVLLQFEIPTYLAVGDPVVCEFAVTHEPDRPLPCWGVGDVVRVDGCQVAVDFKAGGLAPLESETDGVQPCDSEPGKP